MQYFIYLFFLLSIYFIYIVPFWFLYQYSSLLALFLNYIAKYRKKIIIKNLQNSFPEKSEKEIKSIVFKVYKNLADVVVESFKGFTLSANQVKKRFIIKNP